MTDSNRLYKAMIYFACASISFYDKDVVLDKNSTVRYFRQTYPEICDRVFQEGLSIMNYELSGNQMDTAIRAYIQCHVFPASVKDTEIYVPEEKLPPMTTLQIGGKEVAFVEVPEWSNDFKISGVGFLSYKRKDRDLWQTDDDNKLPPGTWRLLSNKTASNYTEEECKQISPLIYDDGSEEIGALYECFDDSDFVCNTSKSSVLSLLTSLNKDPKRTVLLIR